jgi:hypothetical protein
VSPVLHLIFRKTLYSYRYARIRKLLKSRTEVAKNNKKKLFCALDVCKKMKKCIFGSDILHKLDIGLPS